MTRPDGRIGAIGALGALAAIWSAPALGLSGGSYTPPGGQLAATAPGGTQGRAGPANVEEALRSGHAVPLGPRGRHPRRTPQDAGPSAYGR